MGIEKYVYSNFDIVTVQRSTMTTPLHSTAQHTHIDGTMNFKRRTAFDHFARQNDIFINNFLLLIRLEKTGQFNEQ